MRPFDFCKISPTIILHSLLTMMLTGGLSASAQTSMRGADSTADGITVQGTGSVSIKPDIVYVNLGVTTKSKESAVAVADNARRTNSAIAAVKGMGIPAKDIQTADFSLSPDYNYVQKPVEGGGTTSEQVLVGYTCTNQIRVTVRKIADAGKIVDAATKAGANSAGNIVFDIAHPETVRDDALRLAVLAAARKAKVIAQSLNRQIEIAAVVEGQTPTYQPRVLNLAVNARQEQNDTPIYEGRETITAFVTVRYRFVAAKR